MRKTIDELMEGRQLRRMKQEDRFLARQEANEAKAEALVGELIREGRTIHYVNLTTRDGDFTGKTKEFAHRYEATDYLIRNHYI
jgi:hypothetical protein